MNPTNPVNNSGGVPTAYSSGAYPQNGAQQQPAIQITTQNLPPSNGTVTIDAAALAQLVAIAAQVQRAPQQTITLPDGSQYTGDLLNGIPHGKGVLIYPSGNARERKKYEGDFVQGKMHGTGKLVWLDGSEYIGPFENDNMNGKGIQIGPRGDKYEGMFVNGEWRGQGTWISADRTQVYSGTFANNKLNGPGSRTVRGGGVIVDESGTYRDDQLWDGQRNGNPWKNGKWAGGGCNLV